MLNVGLFLGGHFFTQVMWDLYKPGLGGGLYLSFFMNMRVALEAEYFLSSHTVSIPIISTSNNERDFVGSLRTNVWAGNIKYYLNTQNVTKGLAAINPYTFIGVGKNTS